jgi:hypothetical protein
MAAWESKDFKEMVEALTYMFLEVRAEMKEIIKDHAYSLTMDHWTGKSKEKKSLVGRDRTVYMQASCVILPNMALALLTAWWLSRTPRQT